MGQRSSATINCKHAASLSLQHVDSKYDENGEEDTVAHAPLSPAWLGLEATTHRGLNHIDVCRANGSGKGTSTTKRQRILVAQFLGLPRVGTASVVAHRRLHLHKLNETC